MNRHFVLLALCSVCCTWAGRADAAISDIRFSLDQASLSLLFGLTPDDVLLAGPAVAIQGSLLGLADDFPAGAYDTLNALSFGRDPIGGPLFFSVDRLSIGAPGSAVWEQGPLGFDEAAADVYRVLAGTSSNALELDQQQLGLVAGFAGDDLIGLDLDGATSPLVYFSLGDYVLNGAEASSIRFSDQSGTSSLFAVGSAIGLVMGDEIDALALDDTFEPGLLNPGVDRALFSLSASSDTVTLSGGLYSAADVFVTDFSGSFSVAYTAVQLGLDPVADNVDALDTVVPEAASSAIWAIGLAVGCMAAVSRLRVQRRRPCS